MNQWLDISQRLNENTSYWQESGGCSWQQVNGRTSADFWNGFHRLNQI
ncbi:hypothetical protein [Peribacillus sp. NPDC058075]